VIGLSSIVYLTLPIFIWMVSWLTPILAALGLAAVLAGVVQLAAPFAVATMPLCSDEPSISLRQIASICFVVCAVVGLNGVGGFGIQTNDWLKHNAVLSDLIHQPWPAAYSTSAGSIALVYYVAYYLPAALVGKVVGWVAANIALYVWTVFGCVLVVLWLVVLSRAPVWLCLLGFALFSGLDLVGAFLRPTASGLKSWTDWIDNVRLEWWEGHWLFPGMLSQIAYVPQQALGGWLLTSLAIDRWRQGSVDHPYVLSCALALLWSPYISIGLAALSLLVFASEARTGQRVADQLSVANLAGVVVGGILAAYFLARFAPVELNSAYVSPRSAFIRGAFDFGLQGMSWALFVQHYVSFVLLEFLLLACLLRLVYRQFPAQGRLLIASTWLLLALPFVHHGHFNDLVMRAAIPPLFALLVLTLGALAVARSRAVMIGLALLLAVGAINPVNLLRRNIVEVVHRGALFQVPRVTSLFELQAKVKGNWPYLYQYVCPLDSFFFNHMARRASPINRDP
jgi:hypothetical protein